MAVSSWKTHPTCLTFRNSQPNISKPMSVYFPLSGNLLDPFQDLFNHNQDDRSGAFAKFSLRKPSHPEDDNCYLVPGHPESLTDCGFNNTTKTFLIIHGWTVSSPLTCSNTFCPSRSCFEGLFWGLCSNSRTLPPSYLPSVVLRPLSSF